MDEPPILAELVTADLQVEALPPPSEPSPPARPPLHKLFAACGLMLFVFALGLLFGGEGEQFAWGAVQVVPFTVLAIFAYLGEQHGWAKVLCLVALAGIVLLAGLGNIGLAAIALFGEESLDRVNQQSAKFTYAALQLVLVCGGIGLSALVAVIGFVPQVRQRLARRLPLHPQSFVHAVALVVVTALTLISLVPLVVLATPPLLTFVKMMQAQGEDLTAGRGSAGMLLDELYGLAWLVPVAIMAVGFGVRRDLRESLDRLGLVWPTWRQVAAGLGLAVGLVVAVSLLSLGIDWLWGVLGWPKTDTETFEHLLAHFLSPVGALVLGVVAGLGEELAVRGVLQPRLGIWLSNLFFTALHAAQYHWDALLVVFLIGLVLGAIRHRTNTTTSALVHGTYDFLLVMGVVLEIPGLSE